MTTTTSERHPVEIVNSCQQAHNHPLCTGCQRPTRGYQDRAADHPGTLTPSGPGLCGGCRNHRARGTQPTGLVRYVGTACIHCKGLLVSRESDPATRPEGSVVHHSKGACRVCYNRIRDADRAAAKEAEKVEKAAAGRNPRALAMPPRPEGLTGTAVADRTRLEIYMHDRRARRVPVQGLDLDRWAAQNRIPA